MTVRILTGDCIASMATLPDASVQCCVTSPPYWRLRDYGVAGQLGLEATPEEYVAKMVAVFREVRRVLRDDGTLWLNLGDVYAASGMGGGGNRGDRKCWSSIAGRVGFRMPTEGYKQKDLTLVAFAVADALRRDGWYLRQTIIWRKCAAVEPTRLDRPATSHEYVFLFAKSEQYAATNPGESWWAHSVWNIDDRGGTDHEATMPCELVRRCLAVSTKEGDAVLDPFGGAGTTGLVAQRLNRDAVLCELNPEYVAIAEARIRGDAPLFAAVASAPEVSP